MFSSPHYPNRMDGIKTISSHQCPHLSETGSSPSPPSPPATFRCLQSTTLVHSVHSIPCPVEIDTVCETGKPLEFNVTKRVFFFSLQLPAPRRLLHCWASESIETPSEIIREHSQLCNFLITKETTVFIKNSIQVHTWKPLGVTLLKNLIWLTLTICTRLRAVTHLLLFGALSVLSFVTLQADSVASLLSLPRRSSHHFHQPLPAPSQSVEFRPLQGCFCAAVGLHSTKVDQPARSGHSTVVPLLASPGHSLQTGPVSGYPDILQSDKSSHQPTLVGENGGGQSKQNEPAASKIHLLHREVEIEFLDSTRWIKCQWKYPSHGLYKQQNSSGQVYYLVLFLSSVARHFLILYYQNTDICPSGMCWPFSLIWSVLASSSTNPSKATLTLFIYFFQGLESRLRITTHHPQQRSPEEHRWMQ